MSAIIFGLATAPARAALSVVRLSGRNLIENVADKLLIKQPLKPRMSHLRRIYSAGELLDEAIVLYYKAPQSYTGEDVLELHLHGGLAVTRSVLTALDSLPFVRRAEPGEFTKRAFLNGKMDLRRAESINELISADTSLALKAALRAYSGDDANPGFYASLRSDLARLSTELFASIEFGDTDGDAANLDARIRERILEIKSRIEKVLTSSRWRRRLERGVSVAIVGEANVGKSSIMNRLMRHETSIVSDSPGTTRDVVSAMMEMDGMEMRLFDTAGFRSNEVVDRVESEGMSRARQSAIDAHICVGVLSAESPTLPGDLEDVLRHRSRMRNEGESLGGKEIIVLNKCDLIRRDSCLNDATKPIIEISCETGENFDAFEEILRENVRDLTSSAAVVSSIPERHDTYLTAAIEMLNLALDSRELDIASEYVSQACEQIAFITSDIDRTDLIDEIFRNFCIGK